MRACPLNYVTYGSVKRTGGCFLSPPLCKVWIMQAKGKAPKVQSAGRRVRSRYGTFPRGETSREVRYRRKARGSE